jgi:hypothetical protein
MMRYIVVRSLGGTTWLAVEVTDKTTPVGGGRVIGEFDDPQVAENFCKTWSGVA